MRKQISSTIAAIVLLLAPFFAAAQTASPAVQNTAQKPMTLGAALIHAQAASGEIVMAVSAEKTVLPEGTDSLPAHPSITLLTQEFGQATRTFGTVRAIAPPTMTLINSAPTNPDLYANIPAAEAGELLAATLTDTQWQRMTSAQGLGSEDLTSDEQRGLFRALLPQGTVMVKRVPDFSDLDAAPAPQDVTKELPNARLRLGQSIQMYLPTKDQPDMRIVFLPIPHLPGAPTRYELIANSAPQAAHDGVPVRAETANLPKTSDLDAKEAALQTVIPIDGLKTVGDLISRIFTKTHLEIYADTRYERRSLTFAPFPAGAQARALDLLRSVAYCLTATYRKVGPAYVLTDDLLGVGTRRQIWAEFDKDTDALRQKAVSDAGDHLAHSHSLPSLDSFGDQLALSPAEQKAAAQQDESPDLYGADLPLSQLTPTQQEAAQKITDYLAHPTAKDSGGGVGMQADLSRNISVYAQPQLEMLVPSLDGPVDITLDLTAMFKPASKAKAPVEKPAGPASLHDLLTAYSQSAVFAAPQTTDDLKSLIHSLQSLGFHQLWLPIAPQEGTVDLTLLDEALRETKQTKITVCPVLDLLDWGSKTPPTLADLTILGQTSAQAGQRQSQRTAAKTATTVSKPSEIVVVSLFASAVQSSLAALVHTLTSRPGVAGLIWRGTAPPGYDLPKQQFPWIEYPASLGYTIPARLSFLRRYHADPIDVSDAEDKDADTHLPLFDDPGLDSSLQVQWRKFRADSNVDFLRTLAVSAGKMPIFLEQRRPQNEPVWIGSWDGPNAPMPTNRLALEETEPGSTPSPTLSASEQAKSASRIALLLAHPPETFTASNVAAQISTAMKGGKWDGFVLDLTSLPGNPLKNLEGN